MKRLLIAGCGDIGTRLAAVLASGHWQVSGLRRRVDRLPPAILPVAADLLKPETLADLDGNWDAVVYQATPDQRTAEAYRSAYVTGLSNLLERIAFGRLLLVSSTSVYGQDAGEWVDEDSPTDPARFSGRILLESEALARAAGGVIVRFSGIYGPGRDYLLRQVRSGQASCRSEPPQWTNRIHVDDCAGVLAHLLELPAPEPLYCASDDCPAPRCQVLDWLAERMGQARPARTDNPGDGQGKRVVNRRLRSTGYDWRYPDFRHGYGAMLT
ncbi:MAG: SDR family oxidoreductase [Wenzhouxiangella sp.]|nr:MAG: SDR family oxidoreductase [Wenzhouxiangella sp.]